VSDLIVDPMPRAVRRPEVVTWCRRSAVANLLVEARHDYRADVIRGTVAHPHAIRGGR
jgi:hypothetical protein